MELNVQNTPNPAHTDSSNLLSSTDIIDAMIELRVQLAELEQQIQALQPAFSTACLALNTDKIALERATITRKLTPGRWTYSPDILEQEDCLKQLKRQFQLNHEPTGGRDVEFQILFRFVSNSFSRFKAYRVY